MSLSLSPPRFSLALSAPSPANSTLLLNPSHFAGRDIPALPSGLAEDSLFHDLFSKTLEQCLLRFALSQTYRCQKAHLLPFNRFHSPLSVLGKEKPARTPAKRWVAAGFLCFRLLISTPVPKFKTISLVSPHETITAGQDGHPAGICSVYMANVLLNGERVSSLFACWLASAIPPNTADLYIIADYWKCVKAGHNAV